MCWAWRSPPASTPRSPRRHSACSGCSVRRGRRFDAAHGSVAGSAALSARPICRRLPMSDVTPLDPPLDPSLTSDPLVEVPAPDAETDVVLMHADVSGVAHVTINRPQKKNAFDQATIAALREAFETLHGADHVRVVFVRGAGGAFCAGADLEWMRVSVDWTETDNKDDAYQLARMRGARGGGPARAGALV